MDLAAVVRKTRTAAGLSQAELAGQAGVSSHALWELKARGNGTMQTLAPVLDALGIHVAGLPVGKTLGERVSVARVRRRWSREKLAEKVGVSAPAIARLERNTARIATLQAVLPLIAPRVRVAKSVGGQYQGTGNRDHRLTPSDILDRIHAVIGSIDIDPAADSAGRVRAATCYYEQDDGLARPWRGETVFVNPPYSRLTAFVRKAFACWQAGECRTVLMLLPVRTEVSCFHECIVGHADVFFLRGAISFERCDGQRQKAPFASMLVLYGGDDAKVAEMLEQFDCVHLARTARRSAQHMRRSASASIDPG